VDFDLSRLFLNSRTWLRGRDPSAPGGDPALFRTGRPSAFLNGVSHLGPADLDTALREARDYFGNLPWSWWCGDDSRPGLSGELVARGAELTLEMPVMAARLETSATVGSLEIEEVTTDRALAEWTGVYMSAMVSEPEDFDAVLETERRRGDTPGTYRRFLGRAGGRAVATSALLVTDEVAGLYVVGVDPPFRGRGYGTAISAAALAAGRATGATIATLQARPLAQPIYERLGFATVSRYRLYLL
jgi:GNAT superfamily N-acetyltransferase